MLAESILVSHAKHYAVRNKQEGFGGGLAISKFRIVAGSCVVFTWFLRDCYVVHACFLLPENRRMRWMKTVRYGGH